MCDTSRSGQVEGVDLLDSDLLDCDLVVSDLLDSDLVDELPESEPFDAAALSDEFEPLDDEPELFFELRLSVL